MRLIRLAIIGFALMLATSCSTIKKSATSVSVNSSITSVTIAEAEIKPKVTATVTWRWSWNPFVKENFELKKGNLIAETLQKEDADVLLEPQFIIQKVPFGERSITVIGYPAKYKNFRNATPEDAPLLDAATASPRKDYNHSTIIIK